MFAVSPLFREILSGKFELHLPMFYRLLQGVQGLQVGYFLSDETPSCPFLCYEDTTHLLRPSGSTVVPRRAQEETSSIFSDLCSDVSEICAASPSCGLLTTS